MGQTCWWHLIVEFIMAQRDGIENIGNTYWEAREQVRRQRSQGGEESDAA